jgi:hypothetical protein
MVPKRAYRGSCTLMGIYRRGLIPLASRYVLLARGERKISIDHPHKDVRDLVLHLTADAPPSNWVRIEV